MVAKGVRRYITTETRTTSRGQPGAQRTGNVDQPPHHVYPRGCARGGLSLFCEWNVEIDLLRPHAV